MKSESTYHYQFGAVVKITLRDGEVSEEEKTFLDHLAKVLGISQEEMITSCKTISTIH
ncbi:hypothetical protein [uncultured Aquimarina sp.]|uniref:hypothetical protein n=1 Tax=uncultured Aquimarina sp. TaxID=575652 RepID=UPI00261CB6AB|nr:hypothetical protein [uncultured Aquimarina sp.]